ncbi:MAG TPA: ABC transporter substrate-binding protein [Gaiellaceae bacterium]|nr:ABC transporter substrate-binding protein [Gaiellaceae bacterium]
MAPFAQAWAKVPRTTAGREASSQVVVAMEQDLPGTFNINYTPSNSFWTTQVVSPVLAGVYNVNDKLQRIPFLITSASADKKGVTYHIRPNAVWNYGGKKIPVTYKDFVATWKMILNKKNDVVSTAGINQFGSWKNTGQKTIEFFWKTKGCTSAAPCGPFADWQDIFGALYPSFGLSGLNFNSMWAKCICDKNGKLISDGPYYISNYTKGQGVIEKANPLWWGTKQSLKQLNFKLYTDTNSEIQAIKGGEVDVANPQPQTSLSTLQGLSTVKYTVATGLFVEHIDIQEGPDPKNPRVPLLRAPWFRQAIMLALDRKGLVNALYSKIAPGLPVMDNLIIFPNDKLYKADFHKWNDDPAKAISILKAHGCTGGPSTPTDGNTSYFTCAGYPAQFGYRTASDNSRRVTSETIFKANLAAVGIHATDDLLPTATMFDDSHLAAGNYDVMEFAWGGVLDYGGNYDIWGCNGSQNYLHYCNAKVTKALADAKTQLNTEKRNADFQQADALMAASDVPAIPLYDLPNVVTYKPALKNITNVATGFTWNTETWKWSS